jgi:HK97 family phage major capsid protein
MPYNNVIDRSDAGALIPEETSNEILQNLPAMSMALTKMRRVTMSRKQQRMPILSVLPTAYFVNGDTGLKQTAEQNWANKYLNAEELAVIVPIPEAVLDDADFDVWAEIRPRIEEAIGAVLDGAVLFGTNKPGTWASSIKDLAVTAGNTFTRGSVAGKDISVDINSVMALVEDDGFDVNGFCARKAIKSALRGLRTTEGALIFQPTLQAGTPDTIYAETVHYVQNGAWVNAQADLLAGDWTQAIIGVRQDITYKLLDQAVIQDNTGAIIYNLAQQDMVALRVVFRVAYEVSNAINLMNTNNTTRCPFAVLRPLGFV